MRMLKLRIDYLRANYQGCGDAALAAALGIEEASVRKTLAKLGVSRTRAEKDWIREHPEDPAPEYTGMVPLPADSVALSIKDYSTALLVGLAALVVYLLTLGPTVTGEDSGELITAAYSLGVAHPPGYIIWCLLGRLFTLIPYGTVAWRVNLMSAVFGAITVSLMFFLAVKLTRNRLAAMAGALAFAFSSEFWEQCVIAEVYSLNAFFIGLCLLLLFSWYETRKPGLLYVFSAVYGVSLCNHNTMHFLGPLFVGFVLAVDREAWRRWKRYLALGVLGMAVAGAIHIYLPIRSMANPPVDWGNPETWENFWEHVLRKQYSFEDTPRTVPRTISQFAVFLRLYANEFTPLLAWLPLLGVYPLWNRCRYRFGLVIGLFLMVSMGFLLVLNFNIDRQSIWLNNVFWLPAYMMSALLMATAIGWLAGLAVDRHRLWAPGVLLLAMATWLLPLVNNYARNDKSDYYFSYDYATNVLKTLDQNAIYFPTADHATFPVLYLQAVEGMRPDVTIANKYGYPEETIYADMPFELRTKFPKIPSDAEEAEIEDWVIANTDRPVYFTKKRAVNLPETTMVNAGLLYAVVRPGQQRPERDYWDEYQWHTLDENDVRGELTAEMILSDYYFARGRDCLEKGNADEGLGAFDAALRIGGENKESLNNVGSASAEHGAFEASMAYYERAVVLDPEYDLALRNLNKLYIRTNQHEKAIPLLKTLLKKHPLDREANDTLVDSLLALDKVDDALERLEWIAQQAPDNPDIYRRMGFVYMNNKEDADTAREMFAKSLELNPNQPDIAMLAPPNPTGPQMPQVSQAPGMPGTPTAPEIPAGMSIPGAPAGPGIPGMPNLPQLPQF